jgi:hypothetical protein
LPQRSADNETVRDHLAREPEEQTMADPQTKLIQKLQIELILVSLILLVGAMAWTWQIGMASNRLDHELDHAGEDLKGLRQSIERLEARHA